MKSFYFFGSLVKQGTSVHKVETGMGIPYSTLQKKLKIVKDGEFKSPKLGTHAVVNEE